ncbi:co-chaperone GroES [Mucisphaera calidilacus]|uniref:Co-chaperonin GroES n=1 Tax=Mucisphaera calidilacus TaxID=2527982 RepID=A0A518BUW2_9BACT|nr:co-chaperone GroES [Mucisphaera calidilacus]QDU70773.1 10 kDa chaperonin [Mucisphaera calidilacus]
MKVRPLGDKILVQRVAAEEKTASGIFLPESAKEKPQQAKVIRVGQGKLLDNGERSAFQVKEGDTILLSKWGGTEIKIDGEEYLVMDESEVLAVVE